MQEIKVGDLVIFFLKKTMPSKTGQVVFIEDDMATVYVMKEAKVYQVNISKLKKI